MKRLPKSSQRFRLGLAAIGVGGLALRLFVAIRDRWDAPLGGDAYFYHWQAHFLSVGRGFINPVNAVFSGVDRQSADHPPIYTLVLSGLDLLGLRSSRSHLIVMCIVGAATVVVLGLVGRQIGGPRTGLVAAAIAATYPPLWINDVSLLSETVFLLIVAGFLYTTYRYWEFRDARVGVGAAVLIGLAALTRAEALLLFPLVMVPIAVRAGAGRSWLQRLRPVLVFGVVTAVVISPWVVFNLTRFDQPMFLNADGVTLAAGNCDSTYHGELLGYYDLACVPSKHLAGAPLARYLRSTDPSIENAEQRARAFRYIGDHLDRFPVVALARLGRVWQFVRVDQSRRFDIDIEGRGRFAVTSGIWYAYVLFVGAAFGGFVLFRRRVPILPLVMLVVIASFSTAIALGVFRYRAIAEPALVLLAAAAIASVWERRRSSQASSEPGAGRSSESSVVSSF